jgi:hypothetical protein
MDRPFEFDAGASEQEMRAMLYRAGYDLVTDPRLRGLHPDAVRFGVLCLEEFTAKPWVADAWRGLEDALHGRPCRP